MGSKYYDAPLKAFINEQYKEGKADLYACFIQRNTVFAKPKGFVGMITIPNWMFLSSFEDVRTSLFDRQTIDTFIHNGRGVFGSDFGSCSFVLRNASLTDYQGTFRSLFKDQGSVANNEELEQRFYLADSHVIPSHQFTKLPGKPVAYWLPKYLANLFAKCRPVETVADARPGLQTSDNNRFLRIGSRFHTPRSDSRSRTVLKLLNRRRNGFHAIKEVHFDVGTATLVIS